MKIKERFIRVDDSLDMGTSLIIHREIKDANSMIGDFLSRIWTVYGKPANISFEGFNYTFRDRETGLFFTAYSGGSGPAYGGYFSEKTHLLSVVKVFDDFINGVTPVDCELEFETDFGTLKTGSKNGIPYDILIE